LLYRSRPLRLVPKELGFEFLLRASVPEPHEAMPDSAP